MQTFGLHYRGYVGLGMLSLASLACAAFFHTAL
jgi:hypothetical protein